VISGGKVAETGKSDAKNTLNTTGLPVEWSVVNGRTVDIVSPNEFQSIINLTPEAAKGQVYFRNDLEQIFDKEYMSFAQIPKEYLVVHGTAGSNDMATLNAMTNNKDFSIAVLNNGAVVIWRNPHHGSVAGGPLYMLDSKPSVGNLVNVECTAAADGKGDTVAPNSDQNTTLAWLSEFLKTQYGMDLKVVSSADGVVDASGNLVTIQYAPDANKPNYGPHGDGKTRKEKIPWYIKVPRYEKPLASCTIAELNIYIWRLDAHLVLLAQMETKRKFSKFIQVSRAETNAEKAKVQKLMQKLQTSSSSAPASGGDIPGLGTSTVGGGLEDTRPSPVVLPNSEATPPPTPSLPNAPSANAEVVTPAKSYEISDPTKFDALLKTIPNGWQAVLLAGGEFCAPCKTLQNNGMMDKRSWALSQAWIPFIHINELNSNKDQRSQLHPRYRSHFTMYPAMFVAERGVDGKLTYKPVTNPALNNWNDGQKFVDKVIADKKSKPAVAPESKLGMTPEIAKTLYSNMNTDGHVTQFVDKTHPFGGDKKYKPKDLLTGSNNLVSGKLQRPDARRMGTSPDKNHNDEWGLDRRAHTALVQLANEYGKDIYVASAYRGYQKQYSLTTNGVGDDSRAPAW
jgi:hypothetical protein